MEHLYYDMMINTKFSSTNIPYVLLRYNSFQLYHIEAVLPDRLSNMLKLVSTLAMIQTDLVPDGWKPIGVCPCGQMVPERSLEDFKHNMKSIHNKSTALHGCSSLVRLYLDKSQGTCWTF